MATVSPATVEHCTSMAEVRSHIDGLDTRIVALLAERTSYVAQAGRIKHNENQIVDVARIEFIVQRVREMAGQCGGSPGVTEATYRALIGASIEFERGEFARLHSTLLEGNEHAD